MAANRADGHHPDSPVIALPGSVSSLANCCELEDGEQARPSGRNNRGGTVALPRGPPATRAEATVAGKNKGGREARKPKQPRTKAPKGQTLGTGTVSGAIHGRAGGK